MHQSFMFVSYAFIKITIPAVWAEAYLAMVLSVMLHHCLDVHIGVSLGKTSWQSYQ
jgi:hypothetical protein